MEPDLYIPVGIMAFVGAMWIAAIALICWAEARPMKCAVCGDRVENCPFCREGGATVERADLDRVAAEFQKAAAPIVRGADGKPYYVLSHIKPIPQSMSDPIELQPYQQRVFEEKAELDEKRMKLEAFMEGPFFCTIPKSDRDRFIRQKDAMKSYSDILGERIDAF